MKFLPSALLATALLSGCSLFAPSHPGLWAYGQVTEAGTGTPIVGASISVFGTTLESGAGGCFKLQLADALPFEFVVSKPGNKPAEAVPPRGYFHVSVELAPEGSRGVSAVTWAEAKQQVFVEAPDCN